MDTGAVISAFPPDGQIGTETEENECSYKAASGELIPDHGGLSVQRTTEKVYGVTFPGRKAGVHKTLISASKIHSKGHVVDSNGGYIVRRNSTLARKIQQSLNTRSSMNLVWCVCILRMARTPDTQKTSNTCAHEAIKRCVQCIRDHSRRAFGTLRESHSDGEHKLRRTKLQIRRASRPSGEIGMHVY